MDVGDLHWVDLPTRGGREQAGRRPAIVLQSEAASARLPTVLLVPLTTQRDALRFPGTVLVEADADNGLRAISVGLVFQLVAVDRSHVGARLGRASAAVIDSIWAALEDLAGRGGSPPSLS